jgi:hypothetical protein
LQKKRRPNFAGLLRHPHTNRFHKNENIPLSEADHHHRHQNCRCFRSTLCRLIQKQQQLNLPETLLWTKHHSQNPIHHAKRPRHPRRTR